MSSISPTPQGEVGQSHSSRHTGLGSEVWGEPSAADARAEEEGDDVRPDRGRDGGGTAFGSFILPRHPPPSSNSSLPHGTYPPPTPEQPDVHRSNARTTGVCLQLRNISLSPSTYRLCVALGLPCVRHSPTHGNHLRHRTPFAHGSRVHTLRYDPAQ